MELSFAELIVAGLSAILGWYVASRSYQATLSQFRLSASSAAADWLRDLRGWAAEAIEILAEASYTCRRGDPEATEDEALVLHRCRYRLSALIDRGRLYLPNEQEKTVGSQKARAYRGLRHHALDALVAAERVVGGNIALGEYPDRKSALIGMRREFVSSIQAIIDPHSLNREVAKLICLANDERAADPTLGGLLPDTAKPPSGAEGLLEASSQRRMVWR